MLISRETGTAMYYCLQAYWLAKVRPNQTEEEVHQQVFLSLEGTAAGLAKVQPNQTEEACARLAVSLDRLQNIEEVVLATKI